jgi:acetyl esterase/lipase
MVSPEARIFIDELFAKKRETQKLFPGRKPLELRRRDWEAEARLDVLPKGARFQPVDAGGIKAEWMEMPHFDQSRVVLWLHGGGYNAGSPRIYRKLTAYVSKACAAKVLVPDYRLSPEAVFPAAVTDALKAYGFLLAQGFSEDNIVIGGDSAGGGLTLSTLLALREAGAKLPRCAVVLSPWTDLGCSSPTFSSLRKLDPIIEREDLAESGRWYAGERSVKDPMASPMFADLRGLPPLLIHAGGDEVMLDDSRIFAERARAAGVEVSFKIYDGMWHVHHGGAPEVPESMQAYSDMAAFIRAQFGD